MPPPEGMDLRKLFEVWVDSELKAQVIVFYQHNPGLIETVDGLARRLGTTPEELRSTIAAHVQLGFLRERKVGDQVVLVYDREQHRRIEDFIAEELRKRAGEAIR
jgi:predicted transcriptional regulator